MMNKLAQVLKTANRKMQLLKAQDTPFGNWKSLSWNSVNWSFAYNHA